MNLRILKKLSKRAWYHTGTVLPHYDVSLTKRAEAIRRGAIPVDRRWIKRRIREKREREARRKQLSLHFTTRPIQERSA